MALVTTAEVKVQIRALAGTGEDTKLSTLIDAAGAAIARWCRWPATAAGGNPTLEASSHTFYLDGPSQLDPITIVLPVRPVQSITTIHDDPDRGYGSTYLVASTDYDLDGFSGRVTLQPDAVHGSWSESKRAIKVVASCGYSTVPNDLKQAAILLVRHWWALPERQGVDIASAGGGSESFGPQTIPDEVRELLWPFRLGEAY